VLLTAARPPTLNNYAYGSFTNSGPVTALGSALKAWLTADDHGTARMTDDGSGLISSHTSKDGSALTVTATTTARPTWTSNAISKPDGGSVAGMTYDGVANTMTSTTLTNIPTGSTAGGIMVVGKQPAVAASVQNFAIYGGTAASTTRSTQTSATGFASLSDNTTVLTDSHLKFLGPFVLSGNWSGTTETGRIQGLIFNPETTTIATLATGTTRLRIGARNQVAADRFANVVIRHVFIYTTLTALQNLQLEGWAAWDMGWHRYILPSTHPFRDRRP
jgi:hypothetical protein